MAETSKIEWTDATWNPITGCTLVSDGCRYCYAAGLAATRLKNHPSRAGLARVNAAGEAKFTGEVRFNAQWLDQPLRWRRPRRIFVCAHGDLFHESVPDEWIDRVFAVMALAPHHTFQVLTKRPERMRAYLAASRERIMDEVCDRAVNDDLPVLLVMPGMEPPEHLEGRRVELHRWPLRHVWLGTSVEDQAAADLRIPHLLATPAAVRFVSAEPLLGPVDLTAVAMNTPDEADDPCRENVLRPHEGWPALDWVIVGGESGRNARAMHPDWARSLRDQCQAASVAFHFKQWGEWLPYSQCALPEQREAVSRTTIESNRTGNGAQTYFGRAIAKHPDGYAVTTTTPGIRPEQINRVGKKVAGRTLDGVVHDGFPAGGVQ
ncbi:DUF5131 family protein [Citreimonas sp.]|uniref:DUF5131 family protein n=1 Tax=Citreimonas sp. TaxID=3036715 RepID=UPI0040593801